MSLCLLLYATMGWNKISLSTHFYTSACSKQVSSMLTWKCAWRWTNKFLGTLTERKCSHSTSIRKSQKNCWRCLGMVPKNVRSENIYIANVTRWSKFRNGPLMLWRNIYGLRHLHFTILRPILSANWKRKLWKARMKSLSISLAAQNKKKNVAKTLSREVEVIDNQKK